MGGRGYTISWDPCGQSNSIISHVIANDWGIFIIETNYTCPDNWSRYRATKFARVEIRLETYFGNWIDFNFYATSIEQSQSPGGALHIFWVRGLSIGKGIDFPDIGIKNGINFHNFGTRNGTDFQGFGMKYKVGYTFSKNWYKVGYTFFQKLRIRNGYVFETSMARTRPKSGQVHPTPPPRLPIKLL